MEEVYLSSKSKMQIVFTYIGVTISIFLSVVLSVLLFCSITEDPNYMILFAGLAITFELGKFLALPEMLISLRCKDWIRAITSGLLFITLTAASIFGSIGGLQSDIQKGYSSIDHAIEQKKGLVEERALILDQIKQNSKAIDMYVAMEKEKNFAAPLKIKNESLRIQAAKLQQQISSIEIPNKTQMMALFEAISTAIDKDQKTVQVYVFILLAILLDFVACYLIDIIQKTKHIRSSLANKPKYKKINKPQTRINLSRYKTKNRFNGISTCKNNNTTNTKSEELVKSVTTSKEKAIEQNSTNEVSQSNNILSFTKPKTIEKYKLVREEISAIPTGKRISKSKVMKILRLGNSTVNMYFELLLEEGLVIQDPKSGLYFRSQQLMHINKAL